MEDSLALPLQEVVHVWLGPGAGGTGRGGGRVCGILIRACCVVCEGRWLVRSGKRAAAGADWVAVCFTVWLVALLAGAGGDARVAATFLQRAWGWLLGQGS